MNIDSGDQGMCKLVCKPCAFLVFAEHRIKPLIGARMFRIKLLHPLMTLLDCFFILRHLRVCFCFTLEIFGLRDAAGSVFLIQPELHCLELFGLLLQIADCIRAFCDGRFPALADLMLFNSFLFDQCEHLPNRFVSSVLNPWLAVSFANRALRIAVMC